MRLELDYSVESHLLGFIERARGRADPKEINAAYT
jgi:hypothetical protein